MFGIQHLNRHVAFSLHFDPYILFRQHEYDMHKFKSEEPRELQVLDCYTLFL